MWEVLLTACLLTDPAACETRRIPGGESYAACQALASTLPGADPLRQAQDWPCVRAGETPDFPVTEIAPGVWVHKGAHAEPDRANRGDVANLAFVVGEDAVAAIDAGSSPAIARRMLAAIRSRTDLPVRWLVLTHMHPDHALGATAFRDAGATVVGHRRLAAGLGARADGYLRAMAAAIGEDAAEAVAAPNVAVDGETILDLGGRALTLRAQPTAHTDNDLVARDDATGVLFLGDLLFMGHTPALDGALKGWLDVMNGLETESAPLVVPGHGPVAAPWPDAAAAQRRYLDTLLRETRAAIAAGRQMLEATEEIGEGERDAWLLFDAFNQRNAAAAFQELEWE